MKPKQAAAKALIAEQRLADVTRHELTICSTHAESLRYSRPNGTVAALVAGLFAILSIDPVHAQSYPAQYVATVWQTEQGLPQNSVNALLQDHDGYLWIGTYGGLARFDGERFKLFSSADLPDLGSLEITSLYESHPGVLWIGTAGGGLARLDHGVVATYTERDGLPSGFVNSIRGDIQGNVWIHTSGGLARFAGATLEAYPTHQGRPVREFYLQARDGGMWFRSGQEVLRFGTDGSIATLSVGKPSVFLVHEARDGSVWIAARDAYRLVRYYQGAFSDVPLPSVGRRPLADLHPEFAVTMAEDANGGLLLFTPAGLVRTMGGRLSNAEALPLPSNGGELPKVRSLLVDREGNLWVGLIATGLVRLRPAPLAAYGKNEGLADSSFNSVFQDREGRIWLGGDLLYWFDGHRFHLIPGVADTTAIAQTRDGDLWFGGYGQLYRWRSGALTHFNVEAFHVSGIYQDREGTLWIGGAKGDRPGGLYRFRDGKLDQMPGISGVQDMTEDWNGGFWVMANEGLFHVRGGRITPNDQNQGPPHDTAHFYQDSTGTLWFTTNDGGLSRMRDGRVKAITIEKGLSGNVLLRILDDGRGNLWVSSHRNILRLSLKELNDFADGRLSSILPVSYGVAEGMRSSDCNRGNPGVWKTTDGRIWFPTVRGVVAIDPNAGSRLPPHIVLEEAWANQLALARDGRTSAPPGNSTFDFRFTALSFAAPERTRFKYRLEPFDKDWVDAGTRRTAHYTNMAPGEYTFHVIAANSFGVWNEQWAGVHFFLRPHFYQTTWFYALGAVTFPALLWTAYRFRVKHLEQKLRQIRDVIETIPSYVWSALPDGSVDFTNQSFLAFSGPSVQPLGSGWQELLHPGDRDHFLDAWSESIVSGKAMEAEARVRRADGQYRWLLIRNVPLHDKKGKIVKWYGTSTDIHDRKQAEQALRQSEAYLAEAQRLSHTGSWALDLASDAYIYISEEDFRIWGWDPRDGRPSREAVFQRIHPDDRNRCRESFEKSLREKVDSSDEYRIVLPDGTVKHLHTIRHLVLNQAGDVIQLVGTSVDITERKRAEEALRRLNRELRALSNCNQTLLHATDEHNLLEEICRLVHEEAGYRPVWVGYIEHDEAKSVRPVAWAGTDEGYLDNARISWSEDTERGRGPTGTAIRSGRSCCVQDLATDARVAPWRDLLLQGGFRSAISLPLKDEHGIVFGSLSMHSERPNAFTPEEIHLLEELADDLAFGVVTLRSRVAREQAEQRAALLGFALDNVREVAALIDDSGRFHYLNEEGCRVLGYTRAEILGMSVPDIDPEFPARRWSDHWRDLMERRSLTFESRHRSRDGRTFPVEISSNYFEYGGRAYNLALVRDITERKRAEQKLREQEMELRQILELAPQLVAVFGSDRQRVYANQPTLDYFGITHEEWTSSDDPFRFYHPDDRERVARDVYAGSDSGVPHEFEARLRRKDGAYRWFLCRDNPVRDEQGRVVHWYMTGTDIEDRKRVEEERRARVWFLESMDRINQAMQGTNDLERMMGDVVDIMLSIFDSDRAFLYHPCDPDAPSFELAMARTRPEYPVTRGVVAMTPGTAAGFRIMRASSGVVTFGPGCDLPLVGAFAERFGHKSAIGIALHPKTGEPWVLTMHQCSYARVWTADERKLLEEIGRRVTDSLTSLLMFRSLRENELALRRTTTYLAETQSLTHTGTFVADETTRPLYWSEELFRIFGFDARDGLPTREQPLERIHPEDLDKFMQAWVRAINEKVDTDVEYRIVLPGGRVKHAYGLGHPVLNANGELVEVVGTTVDITERKHAEEERETLRRLEADLRHLNRVSMMGELAASIAHEVNQPISGVVSNGSACLRWLSRDVPDLAEARETARRIVRDGKRAGEIIARIRALATRRAVAQKEKLDLNQTISDVLALIGDQAKKNRIAVRTQFADDLAPVSGDRVQLQQVVLNLVLNAIEAMSTVSEQHRELVITTRNTDDGQVQATVEDSGTGLDPDTMAKVFDPFFTTKAGGMGMGLSISRSILQAHEGRLWVTSKDGAGAVFHFTVPKYCVQESDAGAATV